MKLDEVPSVNVTIRCDGTSLPEYEDEADGREDARLGVRYIEATSGSNFTIFFSAKTFQCSKWPHVVCEIKLDGKLIYAPIIEVNSAHWHGINFNAAYGSEDGQPVLRRFKFTDLPTNDDHTDRVKIADFKNIGEIEINLLSCRKTTPGEGNCVIALMASSSIPEKALKGRAISNRAALDKAEPAKRSDTWHVEYEDNKCKPFATYIFKYRSRRDLQIEGLIPRSPSPVPLEERDLNDLSPEEMLDLLRRKRTQESQKEVKVKKEKRRRAAEDDDDDEDGEVTITEERSLKRPRHLTDSGVEIVDLTDD